MSSHPEYAYADPAHPFHEFPSPPATAVDLDAITLDEFSRRRAARARLLNPELADLTMPEIPSGRRPGEWPGRGRKITRKTKEVNGVTFYSCCKCGTFHPASGFYVRKADTFGIQPRCKVCCRKGEA
jgi:hypothetical protein